MADGVTLTYDRLGAGRPLVLLHGYTQTNAQAWLENGLADQLVAAGHSLILPELRGHGRSNPRNPDAYPPDALTTDLLALIEHLALDEYDLAGYSLGGRVVARAMALGASPRRAVIGGTGLEPILHAAGRGDSYRTLFSRFGTFTPGSREAQFETSLKQYGGDPDALIRIFDTFVDTSEAELAGTTAPTLVIAGADDRDRGSIEELAALLPRGEARRVPGNHWSAVSTPEFMAAMIEFLAG